MKNKSIIVVALLLVVAIVNFARISGSTSIRTVEFLSIFAIGALAGVLLTFIFRKQK